MSVRFDASPRILITGASSGIGRATALRLALDGNKLVLHGRDAARLEKTRSDCANPESHEVWTFDLSKPEGLGEDLVARLAAWGGIIALVHAAGSVKLLPIRSLDPATLRADLDTNFISGAELIRRLASLRNNGDCLRSVVWVSSIYSKVGAKAQAAYAACKAAANAYVRCAALELAPRVLVNALVLGGVDTPMAASTLTDPEMAESLTAAIPLGVGKPEHVANTIAFLVSEQNRWITGQEIVMDGGRSINFSHK